MAITPKQAEMRKNYIGASEISALFLDENGCSLNPYINARDLWYLKVFGTEKEYDNQAKKTGRRLEPLIMEWAAEELGVPIETNPEKLNFVSEKYPWLACNLDGYTIPEPHCAVEAKSTSQPSEYGETGTDEIPYRVLLQAQQQLLCTGFEVCYVPVFKILFGIKECMYVVEKDLSIQQAIIDRSHDFWHNNVLKKVEPEGVELASIETMKAIVRVPNKLAEIPVELVDEWLDLKEKRKEYEDKVDLKFKEILSLLQDAEGAIIDDKRMITYYQQNAKPKVDMDFLKLNYPDIFAKIVTPQKNRVCRIAKLK